MKKIFCILFVFCFCEASFCQNVEKVISIPFGTETFSYSTKWGELGEPGFGVDQVLSDNSFLSFHSGIWYTISQDSNIEKSLPKKDYYYLTTNKISYKAENCLVVGYVRRLDDGYSGKTGNEFDLQVTMNSRDYHVICEFAESKQTTPELYETGNTLFIQTQDKQLVSIEFSDNGTYTVRNAEETLRWLESGKGEELGWSQLIYGNINYGNILGDINLSNVSTAYSKGVLTNLTMKSPKYAGLTRISELKGYEYLNKDSKGLIYLIKYESDNGLFSYDRQGPNVRFSIAVNDIWTRQVYFYEDYAPNEWNPPRDANGRVIGSYSWTVAPDGNIYFTDADVERGEYQIKRIINRWWDDMGINDRIIGQMNTNHIPLLTAMNGKENDGYCFENDFVWITEQSKDKKWSKIKKIDGREGWIETKYIDINTMVPVTNASLGITIDQSSTPASTTPTAKILKAADNLRLRKTELTSSEVITTMLKGTPVKIVATGRQETIDGITGNWVQVEVQSGGKDRNGSPIPAGTTGWCFGGYLE